MDRHLSPAETAKRFGTSIKALRLYEEHGLLKPMRTTNGTTGAAWRVYGPDQIARLVQILALKRFGLSLAQIGELLDGKDALDPILAFQERTLVEDGARITRALALIRKARATLASGEVLSIDDLATLAQETVMKKLPAAEELKEIMTPFRQKHFTPEENASLDQWKANRADIFSANKELMAEARVLMESGDATSASAMDFARRFRENARQLKDSDPSLVTALTPKFKAIWDDVRTDPKVSQKISPTPDVVAFIGKTMANLKAQEDSTGGK
jgi:DNA-binding transcriptional MerR regulator